MAQNLLVIFGATGQQGSSVANFVISDPELSKRYRIRGITRDASKPHAKELHAKGIEVVAGDLDDESTYAAALQGAHTVFLMTSTIYRPDGKEKEIQQGKSVAAAAVAAGAKYIIFSSECDTAAVSDGKYSVDSFDGKAEIERYIRGLPIQSAVFMPGSFMQNLSTMQIPRKTADGSYAMSNMISGSTKLPWIDIVQDTGKFVGAIVAEPEKYNGKTFHAATGMWSFDEIAEMISNANAGKTVRYSALTPEAYKSVLPPVAADTLTDMYLFFEEFGYYGPNAHVEWTASQARGTLTALEDYIAKGVRLD